MAWSIKARDWRIKVSYHVILDKVHRDMKRQSHLLKRRERRLRKSVALRLVRSGFRGEGLDIDSVPLYSESTSPPYSSQPMQLDDRHHRDNHSDASPDETNGDYLYNCKT